MFKMIASDLKGNRTYCKPKCKSKCQPFMLFHFASLLNVGWWGDTGPSLYFSCTLSSLNITSNHHHNTSVVFIVHYLLWWQNNNTQTEMCFGIMAPLLFYFVVSACFTVCKLGTPWVTLVQWCWRVVSGITLLLRRGRDYYSNWSVVTAGNHAIMM